MRYIADDFAAIRRELERKERERRGRKQDILFLEIEPPDDQLLRNMPADHVISLAKSPYYPADCDLGEPEIRLRNSILRAAKRSLFVRNNRFSVV